MLNKIRIQSKSFSRLHHYNSDEFGKIMKNSTHPLPKIVDKLIYDGYDTSPTIFSSTGFKTEASIQEIKSSLSKL